MDGQDLPIRNTRRPRKRGFRAILLATVLGTALGAAPAYVPSVLAQQQSNAKNLTQQVNPSPRETLPSLAPIVQKVMPAVVNISVTSTITDMSGSDQQDTTPPDNGGNGNGPGPNSRR